MENSKKRVSTDPASSRILQQITAWLNTPTLSSIQRLAIAYSGGRDSTVLLHALAQHCITHKNLHLFALHINHGLQTEANVWQEHCLQFCQQHSINFQARSVYVSRNSGLGIEAAARHARYAALVELAQEAECQALVTAHHQDDQVESMLIQLLRGTGLAGASGMAIHKLVIHSDLPHLRPLLSVPVQAIEEYAAIYQLNWIEDPSNQNTHYVRNALRHQVLPVLKKHFPDYRTTLTRFASHAAQAQELLDEFAQKDYTVCVDVNYNLQTSVLLQLSRARQINLLRYWLRKHPIAVPSEARLEEILRRIEQTKKVRAWSIIQDQHEIRFEYDTLSVCIFDRAVPPNESFDFRWQGEKEIKVPRWQGSWQFIPASQGIAVTWLKQQELTVCSRHSRQAQRARLKLHPQRPSRSLKNLYQEAHIAHDRRDYLPLLFAQDKLLVVAGVGMDCRLGLTNEIEKQEKIKIVWKPD